MPSYGSAAAGAERPGAGGEMSCDVTNRLSRDLPFRGRRTISTDNSRMIGSSEVGKVGTFVIRTFSSVY